MRKILIVANHMDVGGIQKSLLELLKAVADEKSYDVSLFCCKGEGRFWDKIPKSIRVLPVNPYARISEQSSGACKKQGIHYWLLRVVFSGWSKLFSKAIPAWILCKIMGRFKEKYDIVISYSQPIGDHDFCDLTNEIVLNCVKADKRITFVHCDFGSYGGNTKRNRRLYKKFDRIAVVSDSVGKRLVEVIPEAADRVETVRNFCDCNEIERLAAQEPIEYTRKTFVTTARLSQEKGILRCIPIFKRLKEEGYDMEWHIVGDGPLKRTIEAEIACYELEDIIFLEGEQLNPYRYMKNADYFLLPSFHEAAPMVFDEAFSLGVPILTTNTISAKEMISDRGIGLVCENDVESIYEMLHSVMSKDMKFDITDKPQREVCMKQFCTLCR